MPRSLPRRIEQVYMSVSSLSVLPSPVIGRVGIRDFAFEACSSFTHVAACQIASPPKADVCPEAPTQPVPRPSRSVATMLIDNYMGGTSPTGELRLCGAPITFGSLDFDFQNACPLLTGQRLHLHEFWSTSASKTGLR